MRVRYFQINAFTSSAFGGNPAGVCVLEHWLSDELLSRIAAENKLSETAFFTKEEDSFHLRWFTPTIEVDLCGHATLATAHALFSELGHEAAPLTFKTRSGVLGAQKRRDFIELDFPSRPPAPCATPDKLVRALRRRPREVLKSRDYVAVFDSAAEVAAVNPDMDLVSRLDCLGVIVTARSDTADFVSRFFAPQAGVPEDPVTGSAHCSLIPFWAERLAKDELVARQISRRGGELFCRNLGDRVGIGGRAAVYLRGELEIGWP